MGDKVDAEDSIDSNKWSVIDEAMKSMMEWTESAPIPNKTVPRHRKSEPNPAKIKETLSHLHETQVPQSAPVEPGFKIAWPETSSPINKKKNSNPKLHSKFGHKSSKDSLGEEDYPKDNHNIPSIPRSAHGVNNHTAFDKKSKSFASTSSEKIKVPMVHQSSSPALIASPIHIMPNISEDRTTHFSPVPNYVQRKEITPPNNPLRRQSAPPGNQRVTTASPKITKRSESHPNHSVADMKPVDVNITALKNFNISPQFGDSNVANGIDIPQHDERANSLENNSYNDNEYTKALLQHQRDRKYRLQKELDKNKILLGSLQYRVKQKEQQLMERRQTKGNTSTSLRVTLEDITKIRNANRQLEIDCNCMRKELDLIKRNSGISGQNFYENIQVRNPPQPNKPIQRRLSRPTVRREDLPPAPPPPPDEDNKWRCRHCTFDNHFALNKCEMCDHARMKS